LHLPGKLALVCHDRLEFTQIRLLTEGQCLLESGTALLDLFRFLEHLLSFGELLDENDVDDSIDFARSFARNAKGDEEGRMRTMAEGIVRSGSLTPVQDAYSRWRRSRGLACCDPILKGCTPLRVVTI
jgi:hypothetical protein